MRFKTIFLIFALAMLVLAGFAWAEDDDDQGEDYDADGSVTDISGYGYYCTLHFALADEEFAQAMVNDSDPEVVLLKVEKLIQKYEGEGGTLAFSIGNIEDSLCGPPQCNVPAGTGQLPWESPKDPTYVVADEHCYDIKETTENGVYRCYGCCIPKNVGDVVWYDCWEICTDSETSGPRTAGTGWNGITPWRDLPSKIPIVIE